ncbi:MAG: OmpA family protein [Pseudomonadota bacterium]
MSARPQLRRSAAAVALGAMLLSACAQGQGPSERQTAGAGLGALAGAGLGLLVGGDDRRNALVGAGIGLLAGVAVGSYLDEQERRLQQDLEGTGGTVERVGDALLVTLPNGVTFDFDSVEIKQEFRRPLNRVASTLAEYPSSYVDVVGHADSTGSAEYNQDLSERRADSVAGALSRRGVDRARLAAVGRGETQPVASNATEDGRARNRRVEILIVPATSGA